MFEKEAEEYRENKRHKSFREDVGNVQIDYNAYLNNLANAFKDGAEFGYNKANEWHYPSKGEYPKDENNVLCILCEFENNNLEVGYYSQKEYERERWRFSEYNTPDDSECDWGVSAWKEIVLPELKESEQK